MNKQWFYLRGSGTLASLRSLFALGFMAPAAVLCAASLTPANVTVGQNLQAAATVALSEAAPKGGLAITVRSDDPSRILLSKSPESEGSSEIVLNVPEGVRSTQEFEVQALASTGVATYTASAPAYGSGKGNVTLARSSILITGPSRAANTLTTSTRGMPGVIKVYSAQLDPAGNFVAVQPIRGGFSAKLKIISSCAECGSVEPAVLTIPAGSAVQASQFLPGEMGEAILSLEASDGFGKSAQPATFKITVAMPGLNIADKIPLGHDLQISGTVLLGAPAATGGVRVTLTSNDPARLLLSLAEKEKGTKSIVVTIPPGGRNAPYFIQALGDSGTVTYGATADGYRPIAGSIFLRPSGVLISGPTGHPDESEVLRPNAPLGPNGLFASLAAHRPTVVVVSTANLDPVTHRCADITVQPLRAGMSLTVKLKNSNPSVGTVGSSVTIAGGTDQGGTEFIARALGTTVLSVVTPEGFTTPTNATSLIAVVKE